MAHTLTFFRFLGMYFIILTASLLLNTPLLAKAVTAKAKIPRKVCDQLLIHHTPQGDVAYKPGVDVNGNPVVSADVDNAMRLALPQEVTIPIEVDLGKYYREPPAQLAQNFSQLTLNQQAVASAQQTFNGNFATANTQSTTAATHIDEIRENVSDATVTADQYKAQFDALADSITSITTALSNNTEPATQALSQLSQNANLLENRIGQNPLEKDLTILQENQKFLSAGVSSIQQTQSNIATNTRLIGEAQDLLTRSADLLNQTDIQTKLGGTNLASAHSTFSTLQTTLDTVSSDTTNTTTSSALSGLIPVYNDLNNRQILNYNRLDLGARRAEVGVVKVNLLSGKLTFNGQPLTDPEREKIIVKCREVYGR